MLKNIVIGVVIILLAGLVGGAIGFFGGCAQRLVQEHVFQEGKHAFRDTEVRCV